MGARDVRKAARDFASDLIMPRSLIPVLAVLAAGPARLPPILFDADGLAADEKVEFAGLNPRGPAYRVLRWIERAAICRSAQVLVRTEVAADILAARAGVERDRFTIVANGRDPELFHPADPAQRAATRAELGIAPDAPLLVYAGSVGPQYRFDLIAQTALAVRARRPDARLLILTGEPDAARSALGVKALGMTIIRKAASAEVPASLAAADAGLAFRATSFSTQAIAPIKLGEYLLCGLPVIGTAAVGDAAVAVKEGVFLDEAVGPDRAAIWLSETVLADRTGLAQRARTVGLERFSLARSVQDYLTALTAACGRIAC
ncbi:MAG: glycosyltransferase [Sphingomicrobium sp.]